MKHLRALAFALGLIATPVAAQVPNWPQTLPANTVVGRLGVGPGPAQAIPFATFQKFLAVAGQNVVYAGPASGGTGAATFRALVGADLPNPSSSSLGGVQSVTCSTSNWVSAISTSGVPACTQPGIADWAAITQSYTLGNSSFSISSTDVRAGRSFNHIRIASLYGQADWCANLVAAITDLGSNPGTILIDSAAGPSACSATGDIDLGANHQVRFVDGNIYVLNQSLILGVGDLLEGIGGGNGGNPPLTTGTVLKWTGGTGKAAVRFWDASFSHLRHIGIDCNSTSNCIGIQMDSDNNPITTRNVLENFEITGSHVGVVIGSSSTSAVSGASCSSSPNQSGCSENDFVTINSFQIFGASGDTTAEGFRINSLNAIQNSLIGTGNIQLANIGVHVINMNDSATFARINLGSVLGTNPSLFTIESSVVNGPDLYNNESEAGTYCILDHSSGGSATYFGNQCNQTILVDGAARITSMSNTGGGTWTVGGTAHVVSIGDVTTLKWSTTGSGTVTVVGN